MSKKEIEIVIPENLSEISLGQYMKVRNLTGSDTENAYTMISVLCNMTMDDVKGLPVDDFNNITTILAKTINKKSILKTRFHIGDVEYGLIPNFDNMSIGEYIDLDTFIRDEKDLHKALTVLFRKITYSHNGKYRIAKYTSEEDYDIMLDAPLDAARGVMVFFLNLSRELLNHIPQYLAAEMDKDIRFKQISTKNGVGIQAYLHSLTVSLEKLTM